MSNKRKRLEPKERREQLLKVALKRANVVGYTNITREDIAHHAECSTGTVSTVFGTIPKLKRDVMRHAIKVGALKVIGQGLMAGDRHARKAPEELKTQAKQYILNKI